jgi:GTP-binding protein EngB required for normal cell division
MSEKITVKKVFKITLVGRSSVGKSKNRWFDDV